MQIKNILLALLISVISLTILLPNPVIAGTVSETNEYSEFSLSDIEKKILDQIPKSSEANQADMKMAEKMRISAEESMNQAIINIKRDKSLLSRTTVNLGTDITLPGCDWSYVDKGTSGIPLGTWDSDSYMGMKQDEAVSIVGSGSLGSAWAYAQVGKQFYVSGSGSQFANIRISGWINGYLLVISAGSTSVTIDFVVWDETTNTKYTTNILNQSRGLVGGDTWNEAFNKGIGMNLESGRNYTAYLQLRVSSGVWGVGASFSDWGDQDGDSGQYAKYTDITVDF